MDILIPRIEASLCERWNWLAIVLVSNIQHNAKQSVDKDNINNVNNDNNIVLKGVWAAYNRL